MTPRRVSFRRPFVAVGVAGVAAATLAIAAPGHASPDPSTTATATTTSATTTPPSSTAPPSSTTVPPDPELPDVEPVAPARLLETRADAGGTVDGLHEGGGQLEPDIAEPVEVAGRAGVPDDATGVFVNLTVVDPAEPGFVAAYPCSTPSDASSVNFLGDRTLANAAFVALDDGELCVRSTLAVDLAVDVTAFTRDGGTIALSSERFADTRTDSDGTVDGGNEGDGELAADTAYEVRIAGRGQVPSDAVGAVLSVAAVDTPEPGFVTVYPCGDEAPLASNINYRAGDTVANQVVAALDDAGDICVVSSQPADVIVDVTGYLTADADLDTFRPARLLDTRDAADQSATHDGLYAGTGELADGAAIRLQVRGRTGIPDEAVAAVLNVTATGAEAPGYLTAFACDTERPVASNVNFSAEQTVPNSVIAPLAADGSVCTYALTSSDVIVDIAGVVSGDTEPVPTTVFEPEDPPPATGDHTFQREFAYQGTTVPARWDPCDPIGYRVNAELATDEQIATMEQAIADASATLGIEMEYLGDVPLDVGAVPADTDVVLMWGDESTYPDLAGDTLGIAAGNGFGYVDDTGRLYGQRTAGVVIVDTEVGEGDHARGTWLHELAHVFGLSHPDDPAQLMHSHTNGVTEYQDGDLEGLWRVGPAWGCHPGVFHDPAPLDAGEAVPFTALETVD